MIFWSAEIVLSLLSSHFVWQRNSCCVQSYKMIVNRENTIIFLYIWIHGDHHRGDRTHTPQPPTDGVFVLHFGLMYDIRTDGRKIWRKNTHVAISTEATRPRNGYIWNLYFKKSFLRLAFWIISSFIIILLYALHLTTNNSFYFTSAIFNHIITALL